MRPDPNAEYYDRTGGYPVNEVIIRGDVDDPEFIAFVTDGDGDIFEITWDGEDMNIQTEAANYVTLSEGTLKNLMRIEKVGRHMKEHVIQIMVRAEERGDIPDFTHIMTQRRPQYADGTYVPKGAPQPAPAQDPKDARLAERIRNAAGQNIAITAETPVDALRAKHAFLASGRQVVVINEFSSPVEDAKKKEIARSFKRAEPGTMALIHVKEPKPEATVKPVSLDTPDFGM